MKGAAYDFFNAQKHHFSEKAFSYVNIDLPKKHCDVSVGTELLLYKDGVGREKRGGQQESAIFFLQKYILFGNTPFRGSLLLGL
jgi:hypothetical protein